MGVKKFIKFLLKGQLIINLPPKTEKIISKVKNICIQIQK